MGHYSKHLYKEAERQALAEKARKSSSGEESLAAAIGHPHANNPLYVHVEKLGATNKTLCPEGSYLSEDEVEYGPGIADMPKDVLAAIPVYKETEGKAEGARYCFLADIANVVKPEHSDLGNSLSRLVRAVEHNDVEKALRCTSDVIRELSSDALMNDLIGVRAQALASGKYKFESYREEIDVNLLLDAAARHFLKILFVSDTDEESGFAHTAHIAANVIMINAQLSLHR